jgi:hypothetical protein
MMVVFPPSPSFGKQENRYCYKNQMTRGSFKIPTYFERASLAMCTDISLIYHYCITLILTLNFDIVNYFFDSRANFMVRSSREICWFYKVLD